MSSASKERQGVLVQGPFRDSKLNGGLALGNLGTSCRFTLCSILIGGHDTLRRNRQYLKKINVRS